MSPSICKLSRRVEQCREAAGEGQARHDRGNVGPRFELMPCAIDLDNQPQRIAIDVCDEWPDRILPTKLPSTETAIAKPTPDDSLRQRVFPPKISRALRSE